MYRFDFFFPILDTESGDGDDSILRCSHCECSYPQIGALRSHMEEAHPDKPNKNICDKCGAAFVLRTQLEKHLTFHSPTSQVRVSGYGILRLKNKVITFQNV